MANRGTRLLAVGIISGLVGAGLAGAVSAQVSPQDQGCITTFNKGVRKVAKAQSKIVRKCLSDFAAGKLATSTPEDCVRSDPSGKVDRTADSAAAKTADKCSAGMPAFGVTPVETAFARAALSQIDLAHGSYGRSLNFGLIANADDASCQARVGATLLKCEDRRLREFLKCQKIDLRGGAITDAASLADSCLGVGSNPQPDPSGRIAYDCGSKLADEIARSCTSTDLVRAFAPCNAVDPAGTADCLKRESACQLCLLLNDVDALTRDCDLFDDGNGTNGSCGRECGDGVLQGDEICDDGNNADLDGCSAVCTTEGGWTCEGQPSVCTLKCGDGVLDAGEACDDGDAQSGDGCSSTCQVEDGYSCIGQPSVCSPNCGNGTIQSGDGEACDDGDTQNSDGCSSTCQVEGGYNCSGEPSVCTFVCGNGTFQTGETCDDGDAAGGDGCSGVCTIETGWLCFGQPSTCLPVCGDGLKRGGELCDDGNPLGGDGCSPLCQTEAGFQCTGEPSHCLAVCGDGFIRGFETCDDTNTTSGDGCSGNFCLNEPTHTCLGQPSVCVLNCGDGNLDSPEQCDDGGQVNGDGCSSTCLTEAGYACAGQPSVCVSTCGNSGLDAGETCDDGNTVSGDGCSKGCRNEPGWLCSTLGQPCATFDIFIDSPAHGIFTTASSVVISGHYTTLPAGQVAITINGEPASSVNQVSRTFSHTLTLDPVVIFNPVLATLTNTANGDSVRDRVVVIVGSSVADGAYSPQSVAMRLNDSGLDAMEPLVGDMAAGQFDLGALIPVGTVLIDDCFIDVIGCWGSAQARIANPPPSIGTFQLLMDSKTNAVFGDIRINNLRVDVDIDGSGLVPDCGLRLVASQMRLTGDYTLEPLVSDPSNIDVNLATPLGVSFTSFNYTFTYGLCDAPIIGDIIQALLPDIEQEMINAIKGYLGDPDGSGPQDSPIAGGIQDALAGISITGPVGEGIGLMFQSPLFAVTEDNSGITLGSNGRFMMSIGSGPGQCIPPPGAPNLTASYSISAPFPSYGPTTPGTGQAYGLGISISGAGFNQLLRGQTECGLMRTSLTEVDLDGEGGLPPLPVTSTLLALIVPEFSQLPPNTPLRMDIAPTLAPIVTGNAGPSGELTELKIAQISLQVVEPGPETVWLSGALDTRLGMNLDFLPDGTGLAIDLGAPLPGDLSITIIENPLGANEAQVETVLPSLMQSLIPQLAGALSSFPLPQLFGLGLQGVEVSRSGQFMSLYANLVPTP